MNSSGHAQPRPIALKKQGDDQLAIEWSDGHRGVYAWRHLRLNCPCAGCRGERENSNPDPFRILKESEIPRGPPKPVAVRPVGSYAYCIVWNDGHDTGIFTLDLLRSLCQCSECVRGVNSQ